MELHQLRYFLAVAQTASFSRAAERCHVSQPSLSQQIMKLEGELEERLFERTKRRVALTPAGERLVEHAERVLAEVETAREQVREGGGPVRGQVALGALPTVAPYLLPAVLRRMADEHPGIAIVAHEDTTAGLLQGVLGRELDLAVLSLPVRERGLVVHDLGAEELWLALPAAHRLAAQRTVDPAALAQEPFLLMREGHCLAAQATAFCEARGVAPAVSFRSAQMETMQALVAASLGVSLVPAMARREIAGLVYRRVRGVAPVRRLAAVQTQARTPSRAVLAVLAAVEEEARRLFARGE